MPGQHAITSFLAGKAIYNNQAGSPALKYLFLHSSLPRLDSSWNSHTCIGQSPYQMDHQAEQSVITFSKLLFSHTPYIISVKMREWFQLWKYGNFNYLSMDKKKLKIGNELLAFFLTFKAEVHSKAPQNNTKHLPFNCAFPPVNIWNVSWSTLVLCKLLSVRGVWLYWSRNKKRKGCSLRLALPREDWGS